ncbi:MAG: alpha/beta fold hydrolase [Burkholderiaceae bacterium]
MNLQPSIRRWRSAVVAVSVALLLAACGGDDSTSTAVGSDTEVPAANNDDNGAPGTDTAGQDGTGDASPPTPAFAPVPALGAAESFALGDGQWLAVDATPGQAGAPTLLAIHDLGASSVQWRPLIERSPAEWHWLSVDLRGHGNASEPLEPASFDLHLNDLLRLIDTLDDPQLVVIGSGLGARLATALARERATRIGALVLIAADDGSVASDTLVELRDRLAATAPSDATPSTTFLNDWQAAGAITGDAVTAPLARPSTTTWLAGLNALLDARVADAAGAGPAQPALRLLGETDRLLAPAAAESLGEALRADVVVRIDGAGRQPERDASERVLELIRRFLSPRGSLHAASPRRLVTIDETNALTASGVQRALVRDVTGEAFCDVRIVELEYQTVGAAGESTNASAIVGVPQGGRAECQGARPLLLYGHGTSASRDYDFASSTEGFGGLALAMFAARGYIVVAPQYTGYGTSWLDYHPYLQADAQSADMIDALRASEQWLSENGLQRRELFLGGYSQGGHVAMATQRRLERELADRFTVTGSFPMSGPYALERTFTQVLGGRDTVDAPQLVSFALAGRLREDPSLGPASTYFAAPYGQDTLDLFPGELGAQEAVEAGLIPPFLLASKGEPHLLRQDFVDAFLADPAQPLHRAFEGDSLLDWTPRAPMGLCGGGKDPLVFFDNSFEARDAFAARGVTVPLFDLNNSATLPSGRLNSMYLRFRSLFLFTNDLSGYHAALAPFCAHFARDFFESLRR